MATARSGTRRSKNESQAEEVFAKILTIQRAMQSGMQAMDGSVGMSGSQLSAMWHISAAPGLRVTALAAAMCVQHSTASNLLDKLEKRGLIRRERNSRGSARCQRFPDGSRQRDRQENAGPSARQAAQCLARPAGGGSA
ncbi:MAG: MarR family transcriptional regulator [Rhodocyclaceae bacterium]|nr:MarR family transcriptional regulator [Rhodocyclaceae bacterium]